MGCFMKRFVFFVGLMHIVIASAAKQSRDAAMGMTGLPRLLRRLAMTKVLRQSCFVLLLGIFGFSTLPAKAEALRITPRVVHAEQVAPTLIAAQAGWSAGAVHHFALELTHTPGWHSYWKNPGDSGLPTQLQVDIPSSFTLSRLSWPAPERLPVAHLVNYGYQGTIRLYFSITAPSPLPDLTRPIKIKATWLACQDICIPEDATFVLPAQIVTPNAAPDADFMERRKVDLTYPSLTGHFFVQDQTLGVLIADAPRRVQEGYIFIESVGVAPPSAAQTLDQRSKTLLMQIPLEEGVNLPLKEPLSGFVMLDGTPYTVSLPQGSPEVGFYRERFAMLGWPQAWLYAFLGGLILNIMPCVFPILSLKALSIAHLRGKEEREARLDGLVYAGGIVLGFVIMAGIMAALRQAGMAVGWGFQLQEPWFLVTLILVLFAVIQGLRGKVPVHLSIAVAHHQGYRGAFLTGLLATVLASPCSVPFMAPAIGFALTLPVPSLMMVFVMLGLGMAFPYLMISMVPAIHRLLPAPGPWMQHVKTLMVYPLLVTILWLLWVLGQQAGILVVVMVGFGLLGVAVVLSLIQLSKKQTMKRGLWGMMAGLLLLIPVLAHTMDAHSRDQHAQSQGFSLETLNALRAKDQPVFVYATADWCITCKVNENTTLHRQEVQTFFSDNGIAVLRADWTRRDDTLTRYLETFNRTGVPVYIFYPTGDRPPVLLPQILTPSRVMDTLRPLLKDPACAATSC
jgi:DsbC/DsbD-like thiol-disulfide interchange protein